MLYFVTQCNTRNSLQHAATVLQKRSTEGLTRIDRVAQHIESLSTVLLDNSSERHFQRNLVDSDVPKRPVDNRSTVLYCSRTTRGTCEYF